MTYEFLLVEDYADDIRVVTLNRPERLNAWNSEMRAEMRDAVERAATEHDLRVLVLAGAGRAFSAGEDVSEMAGLAAMGTRGFRAVAREHS